MLRGMLTDFCLAWGKADHRACHATNPETPTTCGFAPDALVEAHWHDKQLAPKAALRQWAAAYIRMFHETHPADAANELRLTIDHGFRRPLRLSHSAAELRIPVRRLQQDFKTLTGMTPQEYLVVRRARAALQMLQDTDDKVAWIAHIVGCSSQKDLNQALARHVGLSPVAIRAARPRSAAGPAVLLLGA
jgi:AraC-like DNA-binding protein